MDPESIITTRELTLDEAIALMRRHKAVTDGRDIYGMSEVRRLDGYMNECVMTYRVWDGTPTAFSDLWTQFKPKHKKKKTVFYEYKIPLTASEAVEEMRKGKVVKDLETSYLPGCLFMDTINDPFNGEQEYIFKMEGPEDEPLLLETVEAFIEEDCGPKYKSYLVTPVSIKEATDGYDSKNADI